MGAKTCLLCGKALSRIWSGAGEDFCSREHRNQYRLRRGMDRLQEANKVASVMRRRESPRQISAENLINPGAQGPRAFLQPKTAATRPDPSLTVQFEAAAFRPRIVATHGARRPLPLTGAPSTAKVGSFTPLSFRLRRVSVGHAIAPRIPVRVPQAPFAAAADSRADIPTPRRILVSAWRTAARTVVGDMLRRVQPFELNPIDTARSARRLFAPSQGRALRVSLAIGFHFPKGRVPAIAIAQPEPAGITWPVIINLCEKALDRCRPEPAAEDIPISIPGMRIPAAPPSDFDGRFRWPGALELSLHFVSPVVRHRTAFVPFGNADEGAGKEHLHEYRN
jgi:hypothetical protein